MFNRGQTALQQLLNTGVLPASAIPGGSGGGFILPSNVDPTGTSDSYAGLQTWLDNLSAHGGIGLLYPGTYKSSQTLVAQGNSIMVQGCGSNTTKIMTSTSGIDGFKVNVTGDGNATPSGYIADIAVIGPSANPTDFHTAWRADACRGFRLIGCDAGNFDMGLDFHNNCFNMAIYDFSCHRFGSCNIGINLRGIEGAAFQAGNDISFYNTIISAKLGAIVVGPNSGGYHFFGGQIGSSGLTANRDDLGCIMLGVTYDSVLQSGTGTLTTGGCTADFHGMSIEGVNRTWFIQCYDEITATFHALGFTPSTSGANAALGILKAQNSKNSQLSFTGSSSIQAGGVLQTAVASFAGGGSAFLIQEGPWQQGSLTVNGSGLGTRVMQSLAQQSNAPSVGLGMARRSSLPISMLGQMWLRGSISTGGVLQFCVDNAGTTWNAV